MEDTDGGLHPAVDGQSLDEDEDRFSTFLVHVNVILDSRGDVHPFGSCERHS